MSKFDEWCVLEIMGHQTYAGRVTEQEIAGASLLRIDVPQCGDVEPFSKLFGVTSVYCLTPVSEQVARMRAEALKKTPLTVWDLPEGVRDRLRAAPALPAPETVCAMPGDYYDDDQDYDEDDED